MKVVARLFTCVSPLAVLWLMIITTPEVAASNKTKSAKSSRKKGKIKEMSTIKPPTFAPTKSPTNTNAPTKFPIQEPTAEPTPLEISFADYVGWSNAIISQYYAGELEFRNIMMGIERDVSEISEGESISMPEVEYEDIDIAAVQEHKVNYAAELVKTKMQIKEATKEDILFSSHCSGSAGEDCLLLLDDLDKQQQQQVTMIQETLDELQVAIDDTMHLLKRDMFIPDTQCYIYGLKEGVVINESDSLKLCNLLWSIIQRTILGDSDLVIAEADVLELESGEANPDDVLGVRRKLLRSRMRYKRILMGARVICSACRKRNIGENGYPTDPELFDIDDKYATSIENNMGHLLENSSKGVSVNCQIPNFYGRFFA